MFTPTRDVRGNPLSINARIGSRKNLASIDAESMLEQDFLTLLEWDPRVDRFGTQPVVIRWIDQQARKRRYTPDVLVRYHYLATSSDAFLRPTIYEVKPREVLRRDWHELRPRFRAAVGACRDAGLRFKIVTDLEIRTPLLQNVRFLLQFKTTRFSMPSDDEWAMMKALQRTLERMGVATPKSLLQAITSDPMHQAQHLPWLWYLVNSYTIRCDLHAPLNMASRIWSCSTQEAFPFRGGWE